MKAGLVLLGPIDLVLFLLSARNIESVITRFINHENIPWWQWLLFLVSSFIFKTIFDAVWTASLRE